MNSSSLLAVGAIAAVFLAGCVATPPVESHPSTTTHPRPAASTAPPSTVRPEIYTPAEPTSSNPLDPYELLPRTGEHLDDITYAVGVAVNNGYAFTDDSVAFHREIFADGTVDRAEYERAVFAAAECMGDLGYNIEGPFQYGPNTGEFVTVGSNPADHMYYWAINAPPTFDADIEVCQELWEFTISEVWNAVNLPTEAERQAWLEAAWNCARERGLTLSEPPTELEAMQVASECEPWNALPDK